MSLLPRGAQTRPRTTRQEALLRELQKLFADEGFSSFTLGDLATRLACSRRTLYELAASKDELVALVVESFLDENFRRGMDATLGLTSARERLTAFATAVIDDAQRMSDAFADDVFGTPRTAALVAHYDQRCITLGENLVRDGQERGEFRPVDPVLAAHGLMAAVARMQDTTVLNLVDRTYPDAVREIIDLFLSGLLARDTTDADA